MEKIRFSYYSIVFAVFTQIQLILCNTCAYYENFPNMLPISYTECSRDCCKGYPTKKKDACCSNDSDNSLWWIVFIVIAAVACLIGCIVICVCLRKKEKQLAKEKSLVKNDFNEKKDELNANNNENNNDNKRSPYSIKLKPIGDPKYEAYKTGAKSDSLGLPPNTNPALASAIDILDNQDLDFDRAPTYVSLFARQATVINLKDTDSSVPVLAASHVADDKEITPVSEFTTAPDIFKKRNVLPPINK